MLNKRAQNWNLLSNNQTIATYRAEIIKLPNSGLRFEVAVSLNLCSSGLLERMCQLQDSSFSESLAKNLQAHGQPLSRLPAGHRNARNSGERSCNSIYISEIHGQRVNRPFA